MILIPLLHPLVCFSIKKEILPPPFICSRSKHIKTVNVSQTSTGVVRFGVCVNTFGASLHNVNTFKVPCSRHNVSEEQHDECELKTLFSPGR